MKLEMFTWREYETTGKYPEGSFTIYKSLGEGAGGIIILTPEGKFFLEEIPLYGGEPVENGEVKSIQDALEIMKEWT